MSTTNGVASSEPMVAEPSKNGFQSFENAAADAVLAICYNSSGKRMATASADHKVRIYETGDPDVNAQPTLTDQWRAHDAEILDVQWIPGPFTGHFATTAADNKIKIWREDPSQAPLSGRRFRCIFSASPASHFAYTSFSFHALRHDLYLALFTHDGLLSLLEPSEPDSLASWREIDQFHPFGRFARGTEPRFCLSFSQTPIPTPLPQGTLSLATSAFSLIKIYRALPLSSASPSDPDSGPDPSSTTTATNTNAKIHQLTEYLELELPGSPEINHLSWSPGCLTPWDVIAAACDDGTVRVVDVLIASSTSFSAANAAASGGREGTLPSGSAGSFASSLSQGLGGERERYPPGRGASTSTTPSGITTGLAGLSTQSPHSSEGGTRKEHAFSSPFKHTWRQGGILRHSHSQAACWKAKWVFDGSAVASVGDDGEVALWRRGIRIGGEDEEGEWLEWSRTRYEG